MIPGEIDVWTVLGRLVLACICGGLVGIERESGGQDAGLRTHMLLSLGSALFALISVEGFNEYATADAPNVQVDVTRVASYVAAGVGFIGGGAILKKEDTVSGLTTAASLWVAAAIGVACGVGLWMAPLITVGLALITLVILRPVSAWIAARSEKDRH